jgi:hypothetical protein
MLSLIINIIGGSGEPTGAQYRFSLSANYNFNEQLTSDRLNQIYYVSPYTLRDLQ